jgi:hypothetical protein
MLGVKTQQKYRSVMNENLKHLSGYIRLDASRSNEICGKLNVGNTDEEKTVYKKRWKHRVDRIDGDRWLNKEWDINLKTEK